VEGRGEAAPYKIVKYYTVHSALYSMLCRKTVPYFKHANELSKGFIRLTNILGFKTLQYSFVKLLAAG
jgi:hypothetical protein